MVAGRRRSWRGGLIGLIALACGAGCATTTDALRYDNTAAFLQQHVRAEKEPTWAAMFKNAVLYPARDLVTFDWLWRGLFGDEAWNAAADDVADSSFYTNREPADLTPERVAQGACVEPPPKPPFKITKLKNNGATPGFIGQDAAGRKFLFKLGDPAFPEMGPAAEVVASRLLWALGYHVPPIYRVMIEGTGDPRFDGQLAAAAAFLENVQGHFEFDWFRYRRETRGLRLACAWLDDVDRVGTNTLVVLENGQAKHYLIDFNSCLGAWQGRPKEPWRGWRGEWDAGWALLSVLTLGLAHPEPDARQPAVSAAVGRFDAERFAPLAWTPQVPNTAFDHATPADLRWMAEKIRRLDPPRLEAIVAAARFSDPADARYLTETLLRRRERILALAAERWGK